MIGLAHRIVESRSFQNLILTAIIGAGVVVGLETYQAVTEGYGQLLRTLDWAILYLFARILRVLRLVTVLPRLQVLVGALLRSIPSECVHRSYLDNRCAAS